MATALWVLAVLLIVGGVAGTVLPGLPGIPLIFGGVLLAAWIDDFQGISAWVVRIPPVLAVIGFAVDYLAAAASARRIGASRQGIVGAAIGTLVGIFTGLWGLVFMPLAGAAIGEFIAHRDALRAGKVGIAARLGVRVGA